MTRHLMGKSKFCQSLGHRRRVQQAAADTEAGNGDDTLGRLYTAMTAWRDEQAILSDFGDINQGQSGIPTSPQGN